MLISDMQPNSQRQQQWNNNNNDDNDKRTKTQQVCPELHNIVDSSSDCISSGEHSNPISAT